MIGYGNRPPEVEQGSVPVADVDIDVAVLPDRRWSLAVQTYAELVGLDMAYAKAWKLYVENRSCMAEATLRERDAKAAVAQLELEIMAEVKPKDARLVAAGAAKDRERVLKTIVATDERMVKAVLALSRAATDLEHATALYDTSRKSLSVAERRMSWRNQWMAFLASVRPVPDVGDFPKDFSLEDTPEVEF